MASRGGGHKRAVIGMRMNVAQNTSTTTLRESTTALRARCRHVRSLIIKGIGSVGMGHLGGSLSLVEALVVIYSRHMRIDPRQPKLQGRDRFVLSKGHGGPGLYAVLASFGYFPEDMMTTLNQLGTNLPSHPDMNRTPGIDMTTGSLGQGLSAAVGIAAGARLAGDGSRVYALIGDGESQEGQIWEAALYAAHLRLSNLIAFTDYNKMQIDGPIERVNGLEPLVDKWKAFNWNAVAVDGHDIDQIDAAIVAAKKVSGRPSMIVLNTIKGKGVSFIERAATSNHNMAITAEQVAMALEEIAAGS